MPIILSQTSENQQHFFRPNKSGRIKQINQLIKQIHQSIKKTNRHANLHANSKQYSAYLQAKQSNKYISYPLTPKGGGDHQIANCAPALRSGLPALTQKPPFSFNFFCRQKCNIARAIASLLLILKLYYHWIISFKIHQTNEFERNKLKYDF